MSGFDGLDLEWLRERPGKKWSAVEDDVLPAWVADMDFPAPPPVRRALHALVEGADLGYPPWRDGTPLREAFADRMRTRFGWSPDPARVREVDDIIGGLQLTLRLAGVAGVAGGAEAGAGGADARTGDGLVAVHTPCYPPFIDALTGFGRRLLPIPMLDDGAGWSFDLDRLDADLRDSGCRTLLLVNPQNPTGRVFTRAELGGLAELARRHDLLVIADEVHADLAHPPHRHIPFASLDADSAARTVTLTSATKAFNLAGVRCAVAHIGPDRMLAGWDAQPVNLHGVPNLFGVAATLAAWRDGDRWLTDVLAHLGARRLQLADALGRRLPAARHHPPQAGYLAWIDCRALGLGTDPAAAFRARGRVELSSGSDFGPGGDGHVRLNFATSAELLARILDRMCAASRR